MAPATGIVTGVVTRVVAGLARIECDESSHPVCGACAAGRGCGWQRPDRPRHVDIDARQGGLVLAPGDRLELQIDAARLLRAACRLYLPPLAGLLAGPALVRVVGWEQGLTPLLAAMVGLLLGGLVARQWTRAGVPVLWRRLGMREVPSPGAP